MKVEKISYLNEQQISALKNSGVTSIYSKKVIDMLAEAISNYDYGKIKRIHYMTAQKRSKPIDHLYELKKYIMILYPDAVITLGNDAPRGGQLGNYLTISAS